MEVEFRVCKLVVPEQMEQIEPELGVEYMWIF
jgi:hypothetical protein